MRTLNIFNRILIISWFFIFFSESGNAGEIVPCFVEPSLVSGMRSVGIDGGTDDRVLVFDHFDDIAPLAVGKMKDTVWVQFRKFCENGISEFVGGIKLSFFILPEQDKAVNRNISEESNNNTNAPRYIFTEDIIHAIPLIISFILALSMNFRKSKY
jgi:hypothetical protein